MIRMIVKGLAGLLVGDTRSISIDVFNAGGATGAFIQLIQVDGARRC
jgi:hypothetical protein